MMLAWRGTILQLTAMVCLTTVALVAMALHAGESLQYTITGGLVGALGGLLTRGKLDAASGTDGTSLRPPPTRILPPTDPPPSTRNRQLREALVFAFGLLAIIAVMSAHPR